MSSNVVKLGDICKIGSSKRIKRADYVENGIPFFRSKEIIELSKGNSISTELFITKDQYNQINEKFGSPETGDILITSVGTLGVAYQVEQSQLPFYFKDGNLTWLSQFSEDVNPRWIFYWLNSPEGQRKIDEISIGSTQRAITIVALKSIEVQLPHKEEQDRTVKILNSVTGKISNNNKTNQTLEQIAQAIFKSWFVDFDPVKAKIEALVTGGSADDVELVAMSVLSAQTLDELNSLKDCNPEAFNKLAETASLFPGKLVESELGLIPEGWDVDQVGNHIDVTKGKSYKSAELQESTTALVTLKSFKRGGGYRMGGLKEYTGKYKPQQVIEAGDLVMSLTDVTQAAEIVGKPALVIDAPQYDTLVASLDVAILRSKEVDAKQYFYGLMSTYRFHRYAESFATGTTVLHLAQKGITTFEFACPSAELVKKYNDFAAPIFAKIEANILESQELAKLRDTLLPKFFSGEIELSSEVVV